MRDIMATAERTQSRASSLSPERHERVFESYGMLFLAEASEYIQKTLKNGSCVVRGVRPEASEELMRSMQWATEIIYPHTNALFINTANEDPTDAYVDEQTDLLRTSALGRLVVINNVEQLTGEHDNQASVSKQRFAAHLLQLLQGDGGFGTKVCAISNERYLDNVEPAAQSGIYRTAARFRQVVEVSPQDLAAINQCSVEQEAREYSPVLAAV